MESRRNKPRRTDTPDGASFPESVLRFNGTKEIIVFHASWEDQEAAIKISKLRHSSPDDLLNIRRVGIAVSSLRLQHQLQHDYGEWGRFRNARRHCQCETEECQDYCKDEPLPKFLSLFPSLETFYIAGVPEPGLHEPEAQIQAGKDHPRDSNCPCPNDSQKHSWPIMRSPGVCGWFAIYDERSDCPFPKFYRIEKIRRDWRPHFPYYRALDYLEIRFIQLWDPESLSNSRPCNGCVYTLDR
jgi:hypothetical protein